MTGQQPKKLSNVTSRRVRKALLTHLWTVKNCWTKVDVFVTQLWRRNQILLCTLSKKLSVMENITNDFVAGTWIRSTQNTKVTVATCAKKTKKNEQIAIAPATWLVGCATIVSVITSRAWQKRLGPIDQQLMLLLTDH